MVKLNILLYFCLILWDLLLVYDLRRLVYSTLMIKRNKRTAKKIYKQQGLFDKISLNYIINYIESPKARKEYYVFHFLYIFQIVFFIPQYVFLIFINIVFVQIMKYILCIVVIIKLIFLIIITVNFRGCIPKYEYDRIRNNRK